MIRAAMCLAAETILAGGALAAPPAYNEVPAKLVTPMESWDYDRRLVDIPMRDGARLHAVILIPKGARDAPILLTRTPYDAEALTGNVQSGHMIAALDGYDNAADIIVAGGYIRVIEDVRGKYHSEGTYVMNRPLAGGGLNPTNVDDATDTYDTIDWLVKNLPQSNGKVGTLGISYDGFEPLMALVNPHPALKVSVPMNPMVDGWRGDDWFHNGAFRQMNIDYIWEQVGTRDQPAIAKFWWNSADIYDDFLRAGSAGELGRIHGMDQIGFWKKLTEHPAYDQFWQSQAMDRIIAAQPLKVPVMLVASLWDQEDIYGAPAVYKLLKPKDANGDMVYMTYGPWYHGQEIDDGNRTGQIWWDQDAAKYWRWHVLAPFLAHYLKGTPMDVAPVTAFQSGTNLWQRLNGWPTAPANEKLYLKPGMGLGFDPASGAPATADYISDPAHPVTFVPRPVRPVGYDDDHWRAWLTTDQRNPSARPDVLTFTSDILTAPVTVSGQPVVHLNASTSGTDSDWVIKLIDVYPDQVPTNRAMGGYEFAVAMDIFRGRYRESLSDPRPLAPNLPLDYSFGLPQVNHVFLPGHRIMVQIQSSWFPLYDRNPQKYVPNIFFAKPADYQKATVTLSRSAGQPSAVWLPLVDAAQGQ